jgi:hypothetical protein
VTLGILKRRRLVGELHATGRDVLLLAHLGLRSVRDLFLFPFARLWIVFHARLLLGR